MTEAANQTAATASLHEEGDALFDTRLVNAITAQREITHGENHLALRSAFTGMYVNLKSIKEDAKREEALTEENLLARVGAVFVHIDQPQDEAIVYVFAEALEAAVRDPQAGAYAIKQLADEKKKQQEAKEIEALVLLRHTSPDFLISITQQHAPQTPGLVIEDHSQTHEHTHQYASDDQSPRARNFRRFVRTGLVVLAAGIGGLFVQNKSLNDKTNDKIDVSTGIVTNKIDSASNALFENMGAFNNATLNEVDSVGGHLHKDLYSTSRKTQNMIGNMRKLVKTDLDSLKNNTRPVVDTLGLNN